MPKFNRRGFIQILSAAGLAPALPALPVRAAAVPAGGMAASKALWAGIYAKAGSGAKFAKVAQGIGLSQRAIQGVAARSVGVRIVAATASQAARVEASTGAANSTWRDLADHMQRALGPEDDVFDADAQADEDALHRGTRDQSRSGADQADS